MKDFIANLTALVNSTPWTAEYSNDNAGEEQILEILDWTTFTPDQVRVILKENRELFHDLDNSMEDKFKWLRIGLANMILAFVDFEYSDQLTFF